MPLWRGHQILVQLDHKRSVRSHSLPHHRESTQGPPGPQTGPDHHSFCHIRSIFFKSFHLFKLTISFEQSKTKRLC